MKGAVKVWLHYYAVASFGISTRLFVVDYEGNFTLEVQKIGFIGVSHGIYDRDDWPLTTCLSLKIVVTCGGGGEVCGVPHGNDEHDEESIFLCVGFLRRGNGVSRASLGRLSGLWMTYFPTTLYTSRVEGFRSSPVMLIGLYSK